jgi:hypothetical protein
VRVLCAAAALILAVATGCGALRPAVQHSTSSLSAVATATPSTISAPIFPRCSALPSPAFTPTSLPSPGLLPAAPFVAVLSNTNYPVSDGDVLEIAGPNGGAVKEPAGGPPSVGYGRGGVYLFDATGTLSRLQPDGQIRRLEQIPGLEACQISGWAESPDGTQWIYSVVSWDSSEVATSRLFVGSPGAAPKQVAILTRPDFVAGRYRGGYRVLRWDRAGVLLGTDPTGVGGAGPFIEEGYGLASVVRLNPDTGTISAPLTSSCQFADVAPDGTLACVHRGSTGADIEVIHPDGTAVTITTGADFAGEVAFVGGSSALTYSTARYNNADPNLWIDTIYVVQLGPGASNPHAVTVPNGVSVMNEFSLAFHKVVDGDKIIVSTGTDITQQPVVYLIDVATGKAIAIVLADGVLGAL